MGRRKSLEQTLKFFLMQDYPYLEVIVVNYNSPDGLHDWLVDEFSNQIQIGKLIEVFVPQKLHFHHAHSRNVGLKAAMGDWVLYLDADCRPNTKLTSYLFNRMSHIPHIFGCFGPNCPRDAVGTLFAKRQDLLDLGGYMEQLEGWGYEDGDMRDRLYLLGREMFSISGSMVSSVKHEDFRRCMYFKPPYNKQEKENPKSWLRLNQEENYHKSKDYIDEHGYRANKDIDWGAGGHIVGSGNRFLYSIKKGDFEKAQEDLFPGIKGGYVLKWDSETGELLNEKEVLLAGCPQSYIEKAKISYLQKRNQTLNLPIKRTADGTLPQTHKHEISIDSIEVIDEPDDEQNNNDDVIVDVPDE